MDFVAIDVETANADLGSICQIGVVEFSAGRQVNSWNSLINPEDEFDETNIFIHGIEESMVADAPTLPQIAEDLRRVMRGGVVACHTSFDRASLRRAHDRYGLPVPECSWLDTARVTRRAWPQFAERGYGLANVAQTLGITFRHHDALEDARACAEILVRAVTESGQGLDAWIDRLSRRERTEGTTIARVGDGDGPLVGETVVFTGALSISRNAAADLAAEAGADVAPNLTKRATLLVVGDQDIRRLAGHSKSTKHRKAEALIRDGHQLRIVAESDFRKLIAEA